MLRKVRERIWSAFIWRAFIKRFEFWQRAGLHVIPNHYYQPIPDTAKLKNEIWEKESALVGIEFNSQGQLTLLDRLTSRYKNEYDQFPLEPTGTPYQYYRRNSFFKTIDAAMLYCLVREFKPQRVLEIGSGNSTYVCAQAIRENQKEGHECELIAVEPYPNDVLKAGFPGLSRLLPIPIQEISLSEFERLGPNDILFIDSSHVLKIGGDVQYLFLEILPRLKPGVLVHFHEIFLPREYPREWIVDLHVRQFWTEQYLLQAFLTFNECYEVMWAGQAMHAAHPDLLKAAFGPYEWDETMSFWIRRVK